MKAVIKIVITISEFWLGFGLGFIASLIFTVGTLIIIAKSVKNK
jgi:hypothetical protein